MKIMGILPSVPNYQTIRAQRGNRDPLLRLVVCDWIVSVLREANAGP